MKKISWTDRVRNEKVLHRVKKGRDIVKNTANWIDHTLHRNCHLRYVNDGKTGTGR
jgi:hypothetical protein